MTRKLPKVGTYYFIIKKQPITIADILNTEKP